MITVSVNASKKYDIFIGSGLLNQCGELISKAEGSKKCAIVTDDIVDGFYGEKTVEILEKSGFTVSKYVIPNGEASKSHEQLIAIYNFLTERDITRTDFLIALGGGVVGDLTGFCAATYLRGIDYIQIPTTLLAQVDSSVGGKTAVNIKAGKNLIGAFKQPSMVIADTDTLSTLSDEIFADGMGEVVKYGMIRSKSLFEKLAKGNPRSFIEEIIAECVEIKRDVVQNDEFDTGERMILNFGHTFGHAIEKSAGYGVIPHGKAVAIGMYMMTAAAEKQGSAQKGTAETLKKCLEANSLPYKYDISPEKLYSLSIGDKKRTSNKIRVVICPCAGSCNIVTMTLEEYKSFLRQL
ncbi:MAG: 3-dehydroquinate synthase [Firmicutes bacterium]|nr:3-dehydroquinate synthase [[Eubacterium] siraeum]MCM1487239.1 3-dehydroquinate synthase [Bacillota bacterium]